MESGEKIEQMLGNKRTRSWVEFVSALICQAFPHIVVTTAKQKLYFHYFTV